MSEESHSGKMPPDASPAGSATPGSPGGLRRLVQKLDNSIQKTISRLRPPQGFMPPPPSPDQVPDKRTAAISKTASSQDMPPATPSKSTPAAVPPAATPCNQAPCPSPQAQAPRVPKKLDPLIERTKIDFEACKAVVNRFVADKEVDVRVRIAAAQAIAEPAPTKPEQPIEMYRNATPCAARWENMSGGECFRVCETCKLHLYNFKDLDLQEAQKLVYQREGIRNPSFYRRKDGKFATHDCPVAVRRGRTMLAIIAASILVVGGGIVLMFVMPRPPQPEVTVVAPESGETKQAKTSRAGTRERVTSPTGDVSSEQSSFMSDVFGPQPMPQGESGVPPAQGFDFGQQAGMPNTFGTGPMPQVGGIAPPTQAPYAGGQSPQAGAAAGPSNQAPPAGGYSQLPTAGTAGGASQIPFGALSPQASPGSPAPTEGVAPPDSTQQPENPYIKNY